MFESVNPNSPFAAPQPRATIGRGRLVLEALGIFVAMFVVLALVPEGLAPLLIFVWMALASVVWRDAAEMDLHDYRGPFSSPRSASVFMLIIPILAVPIYWFQRRTILLGLATRRDEA